jgi:hypothetical protein
MAYRSLGRTYSGGGQGAGGRFRRWRGVTGGTGGTGNFLTSPNLYFLFSFLFFHSTRYAGAGLEHVPPVPTTNFPKVQSPDSIAFGFQLPVVVHLLSREGWPVGDGQNRPDPR